MTRVAPREQPADRVLRIQRELEATCADVYAAWTNPEQIVEWWGPDGFTVPKSRFDVQPGGEWTTTMRSPEGEEFTVTGVFKELVEPSRIVMTWAWIQDGSRGHETVVSVDLESRGKKTMMCFEQRLFEAADSRDQHEQGWTSSFVCLDRALAA